MEHLEKDEIEEIKLTAEEEARIDEAIRNARDPYDEEVAVSAEYDRRHELLIVRLKTGQRLAIPREDLQDLADSDAERAAKVELEMLGMSLHWEELNIDFRVDSLRQGVYGSERWMRGLEERRRTRAAALLSRTA